MTENDCHFYAVDKYLYTKYTRVIRQTRIVSARMQRPAATTWRGKKSKKGTGKDNGRDREKRRKKCGWRWYPDLRNNSVIYKWRWQTKFRGHGCRSEKKSDVSDTIRVYRQSIYIYISIYSLVSRNGNGVFGPAEKTCCRGEQGWCLAICSRLFASRTVADDIWTCANRDRRTMKTYIYIYVGTIYLHMYYYLSAIHNDFGGKKLIKKTSNNIVSRLYRFCPKKIYNHGRLRILSWKTCVW